MRRWGSITVVAVVLLLGAQLADWRVAAGIAKMVASTGFCLTAFSGGALGTRYGRWILAGLALSWWGDALLIGTLPLFFQLGLISFLLAHLAYCGAFLSHGVSRKWAAGGLCVLAIPVAAIVYWLFPHVPLDMRVPVIAYVAVITSMLVLAAGTRGRGASWRIIAGAFMFYVSDVAVARSQFVAPDVFNYLWGLPLYYAGQILLASSVALGPRAKETN